MATRPDDRWRRFFEPRRIAVVGASERGLVGKLLLTLRASFAGTITPINPNRSEVHGLRSLPSLAALDQPPDVVVITVPTAAVPGVLREAAEMGAAGALVQSGGFAERDVRGAQLQAEMQATAQAHGLLVLGPNSYGYLALHQGVALYADGSVAAEDRGRVAVLSQSGGLSKAIYEGGRRRGLGFNYVIATGNECVLGVEDFLEQMLLDERTRVVVITAEGFRKPAKLLEMTAVARERRIPLVLLKCGRSATGQAMAAAHTGALAGNAAVMESVCRQTGVVLVDNLYELMEVAELLDRRRQAARPGVLAITVSGGDTTLMSDVAERVGVPLPVPAASVGTAIAGIVPGFVQPRNPFEASTVTVPTRESSQAVLRALFSDSGVDICMVRPQFSVGSKSTSSFSIPDIAQMAAETDKTIIVLSRGPDVLPTDWAEHRRQWPIAFLHEFENAFRAVKALTLWETWLRSEEGLNFQPSPADAYRWQDNLSPADNLRAAGLPMVEQIRVGSGAEAVAAAARIGYPVAVKADPEAVAHKSDAGLVALNLPDAPAVLAAVSALQERLAGTGQAGAALIVQPMVRSGIEVLVGMVRDPTFGPAVVVGAGGILTEFLADSAIRLAPVSPVAARRAIASTRVARLLAGVRGRPPGDVEALAEMVSRFSVLVTTLPAAITAIDLNPVLVLEPGRGCRIVDTHVARAPASSPSHLV